MSRKGIAPLFVAALAIIAIVSSTALLSDLTGLQVDSGFLGSLVSGMSYEKGTIKGIKWDDKNGDGVKQETEPVLSGWTITLSPGGGSTTTDANGEYQFSDLDPGDYTVCEVPQDGYEKTFPTAGFCYSVTITDGETVSGKDFGNRRVFTIVVRKHDDPNGNGVDDSGEGLLFGWTINVHGTIEDSKVTDENGIAFFTVPEGTYTVCEELQSGFTQTGVSSPSGGTSTECSGEGTEGLEVSFPGSSDAIEVDFFNRGQGDIFGKKYHDKNGNGQLDAGEPGLQGWTIKLFQAFEVVASTTTGVDGGYVFTKVSPGTYKVCEFGMAGWTQSPSPTPNFVCVGTGAPAPFVGHDVELSAGESSGSHDFFNDFDFTLNVKKNEDKDGDGEVDQDDPNTGTNEADGPLSGWTINVYKDGGLVASGETDGTGSISFTLEETGDYKVCEVFESGYSNTYPAAAGIMPGAGIESNTECGGEGEATSGWTVTFTEADVGTSGQTKSVQFQNKAFATIFGTKYNDKNGNGLQDQGEGTLGGWTIRLYQSGVLAQTIQTSQVGDYIFTVGPGDYTICEVMQADFIQSFNSPTDTTCVGAGEGSEGHAVTVQDPGAYGSFDFFNRKAFKIVVEKYDDHGTEGTNDGDAPLSGWVIKLHGTIEATKTTGPGGTVEFSNLIEGTYTVCEELKNGFTQTETSVTQGDGTTTGCSAEGTGGFEITFPQSGNEVHVRFGNKHPLSAIEGTKFFDINGNGDDDAEDKDLQGWTINLYKNGALFKTATTGVGGSYAFTDLDLGVYKVCEVLKAGWTQTFGGGAACAAEGTDGYEHVVEGLGEVFDPDDFGNTARFEIRVKKINDKNGNGATDEGEGGLNGVTINLYKDGAFIATKQTEGNGNAIFSDLEAGTYTVCEVPPAGFQRTGTASGDFATTTDCSMEGNTGFEITFDENDVGTSGAAPEVTFYNKQVFSIVVKKWRDDNMNGFEDVGEPPLAGWLMRLKQNGVVIQEKTTNDQGQATFTDLDAGEYDVCEVMQAGVNNNVWSETFPAADSGVPITECSGEGEGLIGHVVTVGAEVGTGVAVKFGNFLPAQISGHKFNDKDESGSFAPGDEGIQGWQIDIYGPGCNPCFAFAGAGGLWTKDDLKPGTYKICEFAQPGVVGLPTAGWQQTLPTGQTPNFDICTGATEATVGYEQILSPGDNIPGLDFGNIHPNFGQVVGRKWLDADRDGFQDLGEPGLEGWKIHIFVPETSVSFFSAETNEDGDYVIPDIALGPFGAEVDVFFDLCEELKPGYVQVAVPFDLYPIDCSAKGPQYAPLGQRAFLKFDGDAWIANFGNDFERCTPSGTKFDDLDGDGLQDAGEPGVSGVTINVYESGTSNLVGTTTTGSGGVWTIPGQAAGNYNICEVVQPSFTPTFPILGATPLSISCTQDPGLNPVGYQIDCTEGATFDLDFGQQVVICPDGNIDPGEECDDGNTFNGDGCDAFCQLEETQLKCYNISAPFGGPLPDTNAIVDLETQFGFESNVDVGRPIQLCAPAIKNGQGNLNAPHWTCYNIVGNDPPHRVNLTTQFGREENVEVGQASRLCTFTNKFLGFEGFGSFSPPFPSPEYKCYNIAGPPVNIPVNLTTQFGDELNVLVGIPKELCAPALKFRGEGFGGDLNMPHYKCYEIPGHNPDDFGVSLQTQFGLVQASVDSATRLCVEAIKEVGVCTPTNEVCDGIDNDCDGQVDEDITTPTTSCGVGACSAMGQAQCVNGALVDTCTPGTPTAEVCDGIDNDCDGQVDEDIPSQPTSCGVGACASTGQTQCVNGAVTDTCTPGTPTAEVCNNIDDDCDSFTDEDASGSPLAQACYTGPAGTQDVGICHAGTQTCTSGSFGACTGQVTPITETCNSLDNDCDGFTDEDFNAGETCTVGTGACAATGVFVCTLDGSGTVCTATPGTPSTEVCNGIDDDCDGSTDEGNVCDVTPPQSTITSATDGNTNAIPPGGFTGSDDATFTFTGSDDFTSPGDLTFECSLDGSAFVACTSPDAFSGLGDGTHTFEIQATDEAGNTDPTPDSFTWQIDTTPSAITTASVTPTLVGTTASITITKTVTDISGSGVDSVTAAIIGPSPSTGTIGTVSLSLISGTTESGTWSGTFTFPSQLLAPDGTYTVVDTATDEVGNSVTETDGSVTLDRSGPIVTIISIFPAVTTSAGTVTVIVTASDATSGFAGTGSITLTDTTSGTAGILTLFSGSLAAGGTGTWTFSLAADPPQGTHTVVATGTDLAGNSESDTATYIVDDTPPGTTIISATDGNTNPVTGGGTTGSDTISFTFTGTDNVAVDHIECSLDGAAFTTCTSPQGYSGLSDGSHTFQVRAVDTAGNTDLTPATFTWNIDTDPPETTITSAIDGDSDSIANGGTSDSSSMTFTFTADEAGSTFECSLDGSVFTPCTSPETFTGLAGGSHTFEVRATDPYGNTDPTPATFTWTVDTTPPQTTITSATDGDFSAIANGGFANTGTATFAFTANEAGSTFECSIDGSAFVACDSPEAFTGLADGTHTLEVRATDPAGNTDPTPATFTWTIDTTKPTSTKALSDIDGDGTIDQIVLTCNDSGSGCDKITWEINGGPTQTHTCSGTPCSVTITPPTGSFSISFRSTDKAGNVEATTTQAHIGDGCPTQPGNPSNNGCPTGVAVCTTEVRNTVNIVGKNEPFKQQPLVGSRVVMLAKSQVQCQAGEIPYDGTNAAVATCAQNLLDSKAVWALIDANGAWAQSNTFTIFLKDSTGKAVLTSSVADPNGWAIYEQPLGGTIGTAGTVASATPIAVANTDCAPKKHLQWVAQRIGSTSTFSVSPARQQQITGSLLEIVYPEEALWDADATSYLYPFILTSDSTWTVDVCGYVPAGYKISGVYDESGKLVATTQCSQAFVAGQTKVIAFEVQKTGSPPEWSFGANIKAKGPKGKLNSLNVEIPSKILEKMAKKEAKGGEFGKGFSRNMCTLFGLLC